MARKPRQPTALQLDQAPSISAFAAATNRCQEVAARHRITPADADDCLGGSLGCPGCPWKSAWTPANLTLHAQAQEAVQKAAA